MTTHCSSLPETTSASQLQTYALCPRKYFFTYVLGLLPEWKSTALVLGSVVHSAVEWFFTEKIEGRTPHEDDVLEILGADVTALTIDESIRWKDASPATLEDDARRYVRLYLAENVEMEVAAVESPFRVPMADPDTGEVRGRDMKGYFDFVLTKNHRVVELKTSARGWNEGDLARHLQVGAYAFAWNALHGGPSEVEVHVIVKLKREPRIERYVVERGEADTRWWLHAASEIEAAIEAGHFPPRPSPFCNECEYQKACLSLVEPAPARVDRDDDHADPRHVLHVLQDHGLVVAVP